jgi:hypothetical protein
MTPPNEGPSAPIKKANPLVIVLAIIGGLAATCCIGGAFLFAALGPAFRQARENVRSGICSSNLSSLGRAVSMYAADYDDRIPPGDRWMDLTKKYVPINRTFQCPVVRTANRASYGYAMNSKMAGKKRSEVDQSEPLIFDSTVLTRNAVADLKTLPVPGRHPGRAGKMDNAILANGNSMALVK